MSTSIGNTKVYQFLAITQNNKGAWQTYVDSEYGNNDGIVSNKEFYEFIKAEYEDKMGEKLSNSDFNIFWSTVDTDTVEFSNKRGVKVDGAFNLNAKEIDAMNAQMEDYLRLDDVCRLAEKNSPFGDLNDRKQWKSLVATLLATELETWRANGRKDGDFYDYMTTTNFERFVAIQLEATVKVQKDNVIEDLFNTSDNWQSLAELGYNLGEDKEIDKLIKDLVESYVEENDITTLDELKTKLSDIIESDNKVKTAITNYLKNKVGLDEEGKPVENKDQSDGTFERLTTAQILGFTDLFYDVVDDAMNYLTPEQTEYKDIYEKYAKEYVNIKMASVEPTWDKYDNLKSLITVETILQDLNSEETQAKIQKEIDALKAKAQPETQQPETQQPETQQPGSTQPETGEVNSEENTENQEETLTTKWTTPSELSSALSAGQKVRFDIDNPELTDIIYSCSVTSMGNTNAKIKCINKETGKFEIDPGSSSGTFKFKIYASSNGKVYEKEYSVTINGNVKMEEEDYFDYGKGKHVEGARYTDNKYSGENNVRDDAIKAVEKALDDMYADLKNKNKFNSDVLDTALASAKAYFAGLINALHAHSGVKNGSWSSTAEFEAGGIKYSVPYAQESHQQYINADKAKFDGDWIQWNRGTMAGARYARISIANDYIFRVLMNFYNYENGNIDEDTLIKNLCEIEDECDNK